MEAKEKVGCQDGDCPNYIHGTSDDCHNCGFWAGELQGYVKGFDAAESTMIPRATEDGRLAGIKEYHDFMNTRCEHFIPDHNFNDCPCMECYEAKLKEWGLEATNG